MPASLSFNLLGTRMVKRASFFILADLEILQSSTHLLLRKLEDERSQYFVGAQKILRAAKGWRSLRSVGRGPEGHIAKIHHTYFYGNWLTKIPNICRSTRFQRQTHAQY